MEKRPPDSCLPGKYARNIVLPLRRIGLETFDLNEHAHPILVR